MMRREDYKAVKHLDKSMLETYLQRIYQRGYEAGVKAVAEQLESKTQATAVTPEG